MKFFLLFLISCSQAKLFKSIRSIHFDPSLKEKPSVGNLSEKKCRYNYDDSSVGQELSFEENYEALKSSKGGLSYLVDLTQKYEKIDVGGNIIIKKEASRECLIVSGEGHK